MTARLGCEDLGIGVGLRVPHYGYVFENRPPIDFFEVISENFMISGGKPLDNLGRALDHYPVVQHGVSLNIGGPEPIDREYLTRLKQLVRRTNTPWVSDHFCWCGAGGAHLHDLLPLPYTEAAIARVAERAKMIQDFLEVPFALENTSSYLTYNASQVSEWQFVSEVVERADVGLMFDVNNVFVSAYNHGFDAYEFIHGIPHERIVQIHLAGHTNVGTHIIDTHSGSVADPVWDLYRETIELAGPVSTLVEWDDEIPDFPVLLAEAERARTVRDRAIAARDERVAQGGSPAPTRTKSLVPEPTGVTASDGAGWVQGGPREHATV